MTPLDFSKLIPLIEAKIHAAVAESVAHAAQKIAAEAKAMIGHEQSNWPALADSTIKRKKAAGFATPAPLLRTGELRDSIKTHAAGATAVVGSNHPDAVIQEHGNSRVPPRPFMAASAAKVAPDFVRELEMRIQAAFTVKD